MRNILFVTLDQFRGDSLGCAGHPFVSTPTLDRLAAIGVRFARHYSQAAPCAPGRAALYTGTYQFNNRVVANGTPLDDRFDNIARLARRAGYEPVLFGYTDQSVDPRTISDPDDPRLESYEGVLPGFHAELDLTGDLDPWRDWLEGLGYRRPPDAASALTGEPLRPAAHSLSAFTTDRVLEWLAARHAGSVAEPAGWFAHISYLRPHPPYGAAGEYARAYDPTAVGTPIVDSEPLHPLHRALCRSEMTAAPEGRALAELRAQYYGMVSEVDHQLGRLVDWLEAHGELATTLIVVTADHGEQLGDHGYVQKGGFFEESYHIPAIICDPRHRGRHGTTVTGFTENVDILPTVCEALGVAVPLQCDGAPLTPFLTGETAAGEPLAVGALPPDWRTAAHWEFDWRFVRLGAGAAPWPADRHLEDQHLAVIRSDEAAYVQFGDGSWLAFDLAADPTWRTPLGDPDATVGLTRAMLLWRSRHTDRILADTLIDHGVRGRSG